MHVGRLSDDELVELIESGPPTDAALDELFERMRAEALPAKRAYVEAVIARLRWTFAQVDDDGDDGLAGVREPRRPAPSAGSVAA